MKGVIFTEFIEMVEDRFGFLLADKIVSASDLPSGGVYTAVGTYAFEEMQQLLTNLNKETDIETSTLLTVFGKHLFSRFYSLYPHFFVGKKNTFEFLSNIENYIHVEVLKLYPDAQLPAIKTEISTDGSAMKMIYKSTRKMGDLALGLISGCTQHFKEDIIVETINENDGGSEITFMLTKK
ncbi:MAG: heme NO-binding domain-containing protein [Bacteroidales bacterium]|nr:heme NO-binding domain-containing protein [Bacteroidales bacterium]